MLTSRRPTVAVLLACACVSVTARADILPINLEAKVGPNYQPEGVDERAIWRDLEQLEKSVRASPQRLNAPDLEACARRVVERLVGRPAPDLRIYFMHDASFNATMFPSGMMVVNTGVLARVRSEAQFAVVLAHEAGHYFRKHSLDRLRTNREIGEKMERVAAAGGGAAKGWRSLDGPWEMIYYIGISSVFQFSRNQESEADAYGLVLMARAGYPLSAAPAMYEQLIEERRASAAARKKLFIDVASVDMSTHPSTARRIRDLADTAEFLSMRGGARQDMEPDEWDKLIEPYRAMLLREQVNLNDPGAGLYLLQAMAERGWTGLLKFNEGEIYRLRNGKGDEAKAANAYADATTMPDAPAEAWRAHGYESFRAGRKPEAHEAFARYLQMTPDAADAAMIHFMLAQ